MSEPIKLPVFKLLVVISDWGKAKRVTELLQQRAHVRMQFQCKAAGTASSEILDMVGLGSSDKALTICLVPQHVSGEALEALSQVYQKKMGRGIAFTTALSGVGMSMMRAMSEETQEKVMQHMEQLERDGDSMKQHAAHDLVVAIINQGFSEELMTAANEAGARGGTVVRGRWAGLEEAARFLGISLQEEKELLLILAQREHKAAIMKSIAQNFGVRTEAQGMVFSVPVDEVAGLDIQ